MKFTYPFGATPLDRNEIEGLIPAYITTQGELNRLEQQNILQGEMWAHRQKADGVITEKFIKTLHKKMFLDVWKWAGQFRKSDKNLGVAWEQISTELRKLLGDTEYWIKNKTYDWDELGARFHRRLVWVHCFSNGNGRHARTATQALLQANGQKPFTWGLKGKKSKWDSAALRLKYIEALKAADQKDFGALIMFVRS